MANSGPMPKVSGIASEITTAGPSPGMMPMTAPTETPSSAERKMSGSSAPMMPSPMSLNHASM